MGTYVAPRRFVEIVAAVLALAGDSSIAYNAAGCGLLNQVALWAIHGDIDTDVPPGPDAMGMANFRACPGVHKDALYNVLAAADHATSWTITYDLSAMIDICSWMLMQHR